MANEPEEKNEYDQFAEHRYLTTADIPALLELGKKSNKSSSSSSRQVPSARKAKSKAGGKKS